MEKENELSTENPFYSYPFLIGFIFTLIAGAYGIIDGILHGGMIPPSNGIALGIILMFVISVLYIVRFYQVRVKEEQL